MHSKLDIIGNVGKDPEMRYTPSGQAVTNFTVAANKSYTNTNGEKVKKTIWFRVSTWGKQAEICNQYVKKGMLVYIEGELSADDTGNPRIWTTSDGKPAASYEVNASSVKFLSSRGAVAQDEAEPQHVNSEDVHF